MNPQLSPNPIADLDALFTFPFMVNALEAGTIVAVLAAVVGWYMVLRRQSFAGHTLSVMAFPGAAGASLAGLPTALGYYVACGGAALVMRARRADPARRGYGTETATIATVQVLGLAAGYLFLSLNNAVLGGTETLLFGTFLGVSRGQVLDPADRRARRARARRDRRPAAAARDDRSRGGPRPRPAGRASWTPASCSCSPPRSPPPARSPAPCSCSRCSWRRPPPPSS